ncbi:PHP domain-containing protein [Halorientalis marina]|uniref:PHP domain-containing protein n=1 Tax=Halorientalis marina TaxID=2931976 RepID=UPI001FF5CA36|nr:PHP domain-containing protein [Halorientalis marina]
MVVADCHVHTTNSDGELTLDRLPAAARETGVDIVAVTDHDRLHPDIDGPVVSLDGITVVHGIELRVDAGDQRVDLLGYGVERTQALTGLVEEIQQDRIDRGRAIIDCVEDRLGVDLPVEPRRGLGRPHIARAIAESDADYDYQGAFDHLIGGDCPCYVARDIPGFDRGVDALADACAVVGLAHPFRYRDVAGALDLTADLDAVERYYPYGRTVDPAPVDRAIADHDLLATGGSDAHDDRLGLAGLDGDDAARFRRAVGAPS